MALHTPTHPGAAPLRTRGADSQLSGAAMLVAGVKSFDLLLGFIVAKTSDGLRTRWGRRKPFIALAFPLALCAMLVFVNAPALGATVTDAEPKAAPCTELVRHSDDDAGCPALKACLAAAIAAGELPPPENNGAGPVGGASEPAGWLTPYFVLTYFWFIVTTWTCSQIPYDALGLELAPGYHERATLYGVKTLFQFTGAANVPRARHVSRASSLGPPRGRLRHRARARPRPLSVLRRRRGRSVRDDGRRIRRDRHVHLLDPTLSGEGAEAARRGAA